MSIFSDEKSLIVVTCSSGIAHLLADEITSLGYRVTGLHESAVETNGTLADCMRLNIHLRTAHRVLYTLNRFQARNGDDLYDELVAIPWERYLDPHGYFSVDRAVSNPTIRNTQFASLKVKDAVADRMRAACGRRPDSGNERTDACLFLHWFGNNASIYLDTTGESLSFRGYRAVSAEAPLRESLAAALILASGWNRQGPFLNPMCGGGTLAIEALWIAQNRPPALLRENFAFKHLTCFEPSLWTDLRSESLKNFEASRKECKVKIFASDIDTAMVNATRTNAEIAEALSSIELDVCDVSLSPHPATDVPGVTIINPPYGGRIGDPATLGQLYEATGAFLTAAAKDGYQGFLFTANPDICDHIGLLYSRTSTFYSGELECRLLEDPQLSPTAMARFRRRQR